MRAEYLLLNKINSPKDLKLLSENQLVQVCQELRQFLIDELSCNPGHFGSSLGVVELTVALHYVYNTPFDRLVWDVGHQAYGHKILTGRRDLFHTNRKFKGISPFPSPSESEYDSFIAGHASNSISAALGMSVADRLKKETQRKIVAIIGDGSLTGGLAFEGLNNMSSYPNDTLIVLNDNEMAIDPVVGGLSQYLVHITTSHLYNKIRYKAYHFFKKLRLIKDDEKDGLIMFNNSLKSLLSKEHNIFEGLNIRYFGPVDGHDVIQLVKILRTIKNFEGPKVLHIKTVKGKGFIPAEQSATEWHAPGKFDKKTGERVVATSEISPPLFQDVFGHTLVELALKNDKIIGVTPAMPSGCSLNIMSEQMPDRVFDVGIAEGHAVTFSAGMSKEGLLPFCNIYSSFSQRAYDNIIHDVAIQKLNIVICLDRAGIVGHDGATHHGVFDMAFLRCIPHLTIASPLNEVELRNLLYTSQLPNKGAFVIRYPRGKGVLVDWKKPMQEIKIGSGVCLKKGNDLAVLTIGPIGNTISKSIEKIEQEKQCSVAHYDMRFLKPLDENLLHEIASKFNKVITVEDATIQGGFGSAVLEFFSEHNYSMQLKRLGVPDVFVEHGTVEELHHSIGLDEDSLTMEIRNFYFLK